MIDVVIVQHSSDIERPVIPREVHKVLSGGVLVVRSVTVLNANTGLTATFRDDDVVRPEV
jgi:hypothetical protein